MISLRGVPIAVCFAVILIFVAVFWLYWFRPEARSRNEKHPATQIRPEGSAPAPTNSGELPGVGIRTVPFLADEQLLNTVMAALVVTDESQEPVGGAIAYRVGRRCHRVSKSSVPCSQPSGRDGVIPLTASLYGHAEDGCAVMVMAVGYLPAVVEALPINEARNVVMRGTPRYELIVQDRNGLPVRDACVCISAVVSSAGADLHQSTDIWLPGPNPAIRQMIFRSDDEGRVAITGVANPEEYGLVIFHAGYVPVNLKSNDSLSDVLSKSAVVMGEVYVAIARPSVPIEQTKSWTSDSFSGAARMKGLEGATTAWMLNAVRERLRAMFPDCVTSVFVPRFPLTKGLPGPQVPLHIGPAHGGELTLHLVPSAHIEDAAQPVDVQLEDVRKQGIYIKSIAPNGEPVPLSFSVTPETPIQYAPPRFTANANSLLILPEGNYTLDIAAPSQCDAWHGPRIVEVGKNAVSEIKLSLRHRLVECAVQPEIHGLPATDVIFHIDVAVDGANVGVESHESRCVARGRVACFLAYGAKATIAVESFSGDMHGRWIGMIAPDKGESTLLIRVPVSMRPGRK